MEAPGHPEAGAVTWLVSTDGPRSPHRHDHCRDLPSIPPQPQPMEGPAQAGKHQCLKMFV